MALNSITVDGLNALTAGALETTMRLLVHDPNSLTNPKLKRILLSELITYLNGVYFNLQRVFSVANGLLITDDDGKLKAATIETAGAINVAVDPVLSKVTFTVTPGNIPTAEDTLAGGVRVNTNDPGDDPVVYRKQEVDSIITGLTNTDSAIQTEVDTLDAAILALQAINADTRLNTAESELLILDSRLDAYDGQTLNTRLNTLEGQNLNTRLTAVEGDIAIASGSWNSVTGNNSLVGLAGTLTGQSTITGVSFSSGGFCIINTPGLYIIQAAGPLSSSATAGNFATLMHYGIGMQSNGVGSVTDSVRWSGTNFSDRIVNGIQGNVMRIESIGTGQTRVFQVLINNNALNGLWTGALAMIVIRLKRY